MKKFPFGLNILNFLSEHKCMNNNLFWDRVKELVKQSSYSLDSLAESCGISKNTMTGWISKGRLPDAEQAQLLATALHTTVEYLVTGNQSSEREKADKLVKNIQNLLTAYNS